MAQKLLLVSFFWLSMLVTACGQTQSATLPPTGKVSVAMKQLLPSGVAKVSVMDSITMDPRLTGLLVKFQQGIKANPQYMIDMQKRTAAQGPGPMPYDKRVGMSEPEFQEFQTLMGKREMRVAASYVGEVTVAHKDGTIHFAGTSRLDMLNEMWIDLAKNEVHFSEYTLPYTKEITVTDAKNAFGSAWTSYEWELTKPDGETFEDISLEKLKSMNMLMLQLHVGKLTKTGKTFLKIKGTRIDKGIKKFSFDTPLFFE
jgi:hypothetical protein